VSETSVSLAGSPSLTDPPLRHRQSSLFRCCLPPAPRHSVRPAARFHAAASPRVSTALISIEGALPKRRRVTVRTLST